MTFRVVFLYILCFWFKFGFAQLGNKLIIKCLDLINPDTTILYYPIENRIKVYYNNNETSNFTLSIIGGKIKKVNDYYTINVLDRNRVTLLVHKNEKNNHHVDKVYFFVKDFIEPAIKICGVKGGFISHKKLLKEEKIMLNNDENPYLKQDFKIKSFKLVIYNDTQTISLISNSEYFTIEQKEALKKLKKGLKFYIEDIKVDSEDKKIKIMPTAFTIQ